MTSKTKKAEMSIIAGCFQGLTSLLLNFTHSAEEGEEGHLVAWSFTSSFICLSVLAVGVSVGGEIAFVLRCRWKAFF